MNQTKKKDDATEPKERKARKKADIPENETPSQRFVRIGRPRVNAALAKIKLIGNLAGSGYEYAEADLDKIAKALSDRVDAVIQRLKDNLDKASGASKADDFDF